MCVLRAIIIRDTCSLACFHATGTHHDDGSQISGGSCVCYHTMLHGLQTFGLQSLSLKPVPLAHTVEMCLVLRQMLVCIQIFIFNSGRRANWELSAEFFCVPSC